MFPAIVADIGGTNGRFGLVTGENESGYIIEQVKVYQVDKYPSFEDMVAVYMNQLNDIPVSAACFAIAGPISGDIVQFSNVQWSFSQSALASRFGFQYFEVINDFFAVAMACQALREGHLIQLKAGQPKPKGIKAALGPGTGLGVAGLAFHSGLWAPIPCEGGHVNISPATPLECELIKVAMLNHGHVSAETLLSGPGIVNLYQSLAQVHGQRPNNSLSGKDITTQALANEPDILCHETFDVFCSLLGSFAGNLALTFGASGGVYLAGGILPQFVDFVRHSSFVERFSEKGNMSHYLKNIPVYIIDHPHTAFVGAAGWLKQNSA